MLQERLERQHQNNEEERARLQGLINQLENQLTNQTREIEEVSRACQTGMGQQYASLVNIYLHWHCFNLNIYVLGTVKLCPIY